MKHWQYQNPVEIHFGAGVLETLPKVLAGRNATAGDVSGSRVVRPAGRACARCSARR